jgi:hypothetical protein
MTSDERRRNREREALKTPGDPLAQAAARAAHERSGQETSLRAYLDLFLGLWCYLEGVKMNYRGVLVGFINEPGGGQGSLLFHPLHRIGEWGRNGPESQYEAKMNSTPDQPRAIPWGSLTDFGLMDSKWPTT